MLKSDGQPWSSQSLSNLFCEHTVEYMKGEGPHPKRFLVSNKKLGYRTKCELNNLITVLLLRSAPVFSTGRSFCKEQAPSPTHVISNELLTSNHMAKSCKSYIVTCRDRRELFENRRVWKHYSLVLPCESLAEMKNPKVIIKYGWFFLFLEAYFHQKWTMSALQTGSLKSFHLLTTEMIIKSIKKNQKLISEKLLVSFLFLNSLRKTRFKTSVAPNFLLCFVTEKQKIGTKLIYFCRKMYFHCLLFQ